MSKFYIVPKKQVAMEIEYDGVINNKDDAMEHFSEFMSFDMNEYFKVLDEDEFKKYKL